MPARRTAKTARKPARNVTARALLKSVAQVQERTGIDDLVLIGALCEVVAGHQPTARKAVVRIEALLAQAGIR
ncbi:MAG: hypothetical protein J0M02_13000 [Planctomycetes bacterium]|nr:hypothetical protein [Planctomycetota bacterium]